MKCWNCGKNTGFRADNDDRRFYCKECESAAAEEKAKNKAIYMHYKFLNMYENAIAALEKKVSKFYTYKQSCETVKSVGAKNHEAFGSSDEILAAIILTHAGYQVKTQVRIGNYTADIYCEAQKVLIEIDGDLHKGRKEIDAERDKKVKRIIGNDWLIIRVKTSLLRKEPEKLALLLKESIKEKFSFR